MDVAADLPGLVKIGDFFQDRLILAYLSAAGLVAGLPAGQVGVDQSGDLLLAGRGDVPSIVGLATPNSTFTALIKRFIIETDDGRARHLFGIATKKTNIADTSYTILSTDYRIAITSITAARTITIPSAEIAKGSATEAREWAFKDESGDVDGVKTITIVTEGSETIDGAPSLVLDTPFFAGKLYADGSNVFAEAA